MIRIESLSNAVSLQARAKFNSLKSELDSCSLPALLASLGWHEVDRYQFNGTTHLMVVTSQARKLRICGRNSRERKLDVLITYICLEFDLKYSTVTNWLDFPLCKA